MRTHRESGWYCDGTVSGRRVKLVRDQRIELDGVVIPWPGNVDCLVMIRDGWLAGSVQRGKQDYAVAFDGATWHELDQCFGRNPCAFDPHGSRLYVCRGGGVVSRYTLPNLERDDFTMETGALGIRCVTWAGHIVTCEETYNEPSRTIYEFTDLGGFRIGHGNDRVGCLVQAFADGVYRLLEAGEAKFQQAHHDGENFCIAFHREDTNESVWYWATAAELLALPPLVVALPQPTEPAPTPAPPVEEPTMQFTAVEKNILTTLVRRYPLPAASGTTPLEIETWEAARRVWTMRAAETLKARVGEWGTKRADPNRPLSKDAVARFVGSTLWSFDTCVKDSETTIRLNVDAHGEDITGQVFVRVDARDWLSADPGPVVPDPVTPPAPGPVTPDTPPAPTQPDTPPAQPVESRFDRAVTAFCRAWLGV